MYDVSFTGDPALDVGDYVRLRGGAIDTERGYATGMITSQTWRYRGQHSIKCSMPSSLTALSDSSAVMLALDGETASDDTAASEKPIRIQPRSQLQKQIDGLAGMIGESGGVAEKLQGANSEYYATTTPSGFRISKSGSDTYEEHICYITDNYDMYNSLVIGDTGGNSIRFLKDYAGFSIESRNNSLTIDENASACVNLNFSNGFSILMRYDKSDGSTKILCGENSLTLKSDGLYYNSTKIG